MPQEDLIEKPMLRDGEEQISALEDSESLAAFQSWKAKSNFEESETACEKEII